jgi:cell division protein FtsB
MESKELAMRRFDLAVTLVCSTLLGYFAWHAWKGPRGYPYQQSLSDELTMLRQEFETLEAQRLSREAKVTLLRPESIDPDLLDEMARMTLEMAKPGDIVAFTGK